MSQEDESGSFGRTLTWNTFVDKDDVWLCLLAHSLPKHPGLYNIDDAETNYIDDTRDTTIEDAAPAGDNSSLAVLPPTPASNFPPRASILAAFP